MAQRRMFSKNIVSTDAFLDMPQSCQLLYFHLNMEADDDGFVSSPRKIMRVIGSSNDDLKVLIGKRFILSFDSGVVVIKHWLIHNYIRKDTYTETKYLNEKNTLITKENGSYTESQRAVDGSSTQVRLGKDRLGKDSNTIAASNDTASQQEIISIFNEFKKINPSTNYGNTTQRKAIQWLIAEYGFEQSLNTVRYALSVQGKDYAPTITTPHQLKEKIAALKIYYGYGKQPKTINLNNL